MIDLHGGDLKEERIDIVVAPDRGDRKVLEVSKTLTEGFLADYAEIYAVSRQVLAEASDIGIAEIIAEEGNWGSSMNMQYNS